MQVGVYMNLFTSCRLQAVVRRLLMQAVVYRLSSTCCCLQVVDYRLLFTFCYLLQSIILQSVLCRLLYTSYCLQVVVYRLIFTYYLQTDHYRVLLVDCSLHIAVYRLLSTGGCLQAVVYRLLFAGYCLQAVDNILLLKGSSLQDVVYRLSFTDLLYLQQLTIQAIGHRIFFTGSFSRAVHYKLLCTCKTRQLRDCCLQAKEGRYLAVVYRQNKTAM